MFKSIILMVMAISLVGCVSNSKKQDIEDIVVETAEPMAQDAASDAADQASQIVDQSQNPGVSLELNGDSDSLRAGQLQTVYFDYDSSDLNSSVITSLEANAQYLKDHPSVEVQIEGHCDERGGIQYNLALGEKRSRAVKQYLEALGVESGRMSTMSYGKERPKAFGHDDSAWSQNRRANFVVMNK